jgi:hypothetical protein
VGNSARVYAVTADVMTSPQGAPLRTFVRVFTLAPDALAAAVASPPAVGERGEPVFSEQNEADVRRYLHTRLALVLRGYGSSADDDDRLLMTARMTQPAHLLVRLRRAEKRLLEHALAATAEPQ